MFAVVVLLGCGRGGPDLAGTVAWIREERGVSVWYAPASDPSAARRLKGVPGAVFPAVGDPRGTHLLVVSTVDGPEGHREELWLAPLDGGTPIGLGEPATMVRNPAWAPDGSFVVYESDRHAFRELYRVDREGGGLRRLTGHPNGNFEPTVAPDGTIAFVSSRHGNAEIYVMGPEGLQVDDQGREKGPPPFRLTDHPGNDTSPTWSPDGTRLAWLAWRGEEVRAVWVERGSLEPRPFRSDGGVDRAIAWSPRGDRVAITTQLGSREVAIDIVTVEGRRVARLDGPGPDEHPVWSPDGEALLFTSSRDGEPDLYVADADGETARPWVSSPRPDWLPRWLPDAR